jgi:hypothetical protein
MLGDLKNNDIITLFVVGSIVIVLISIIGIIIDVVVRDGVTGQQEIQFLEQVISTLLPTALITYVFHVNQNNKSNGDDKNGNS